jgi:outer membrane protein TolC
VFGAAKTLERHGFREMRTFMNAMLQMTRPAALVFAGLLAAAGPASAQIGSGATQPQTAVSTPLALSGRTGQTGTVAAAEAPVPGTTTSVNTLNPTVQVAGPYSGSTNGTAKSAFSGKLSLREAVQRGLDYNLGGVGLANAVEQARGQIKTVRSSLLPNINGDLAVTGETENLEVIGLSFKVPGFSLPTLVGPFSYTDLRARLSQTLFNMTDLNNYRASKETLAANQFAVQDARDLVVLAVGGAYLQVLAAQARVEAEQVEVDTANALYMQTSEQFNFGKAAQLDVNRSQVEELTEQQRLLTLKDDAAKQKINLARLIGLPANANYALTDQIPYAAAPAIEVEDALKKALAQRADLKVAQAQIQAAQRALAAAKDERYPSAAVSGDYGAIGSTLPQAHGTFTIVATLSVPIWQGGRAAGDIEQATAALNQRQAELDDLKGQIESDVRNAYLDLQAATSQVELAQQNIQLSQQTLGQMRTRLEAGVSNNVEVVQSQETVSSAQLDYINSVFAHNIAKLSLARAIGDPAGSLPQFLSLP